MCDACGKLRLVFLVWFVFSVCTKSEPDNAHNCQYTEPVSEALINERGSYTCKCVEGYASGTGNGDTISGTCVTDGEWSADGSCVPGRL